MAADYEEDEEEEEMLVDYCVNCGNPILEGDVYEYDDEGEILCEDCWRDLHGEEELYAIMSIEEADELDRLKAAHMITADLQKAKERADREGWVSDEEIQEIMRT